jgi:type VI secretion system protein ImpA
LRTLQQAELCLALGRPEVASPLLEGLARQVDELRLEQWEDPSLCASVFASFYRCLRGQNDDRAPAVYRRLCQLDFSQALHYREGVRG